MYFDTYTMTRVTTAVWYNEVMKIVLHKEDCIGCGSCASVAPDIFEIRDGKVALKKEPNLNDPKILEQVKLAVSLCPTSVIEVVK